MIKKAIIPKNLKCTIFNFNKSLFMIGFSEGTISLKDSQPPSDISGSLPDGSYDDSVTFHFCCREDGFTRNPLLIPNREPFILFKETSSCQKVDGSTSIIILSIRLANVTCIVPVFRNQSANY